jgi:hypothetical protein
MYSVPRLSNRLLLLIYFMKVRILEYEDDGKTILRNIDNYSEHSTRLEPTATPL